jgi:P-type E1-E2 ATPase
MSFFGPRRRVPARSRAKADILNAYWALDPEVVPGDVVMLAVGSPLPADAVVLESTDCFVNESVLTGESFPVLLTLMGITVLYIGATELAKARFYRGAE